MLYHINSIGLINVHSRFLHVHVNGCGTVSRLQTLKILIKFETDFLMHVIKNLWVITTYYHWQEFLEQKAAAWKKYIFLQFAKSF